MPEGWAWCRLNELADIARGGSPRPIENYITDSPDGINWIKIGDTAPESKYIESAKEKIKPEGQKHSRLVHEGDFLLTNSMSFGRPYILKINGCIHDGWLVFANIKECVIKDYLYYALSSDYIYASFSMVAAGSTVKNLKSDTVKQVLFPLPPIKTQETIVEAIEKSFSQIDILDNEKLDLQTAIKQTKSKILDLAIHGKLVPQDPNDEPAEELLKRIATSDNRPYEKVEEEPFEIPASWRWALLKNVGIKTDTGYPFDSTKFTTESKNRNAIIRIRDIVRGFSETFSDEVCPDSYVVNTGEILIGMDGDFNIAKWKSKPALLNQRVCRIKKSINEINLDYFFYLLPIPLLEINKSTSSVTVKHLSNKQIENMLFPIPPVLEQDRIVKTIEEFFSRLDQIQNNLV